MHFTQEIQEHLYNSLLVTGCCSKVGVCRAELSTSICRVSLCPILKATTSTHWSWSLRLNIPISLLLTICLNARLALCLNRFLIGESASLGPPLVTSRRLPDSSSAWCRRGIGYNTQHYPALLSPLTCKLRLIPHLSFLAADIFMIQLLDQIFIQCQKIQYPCLSVHYFVPGLVSTVAVHRNIKTL